ncbi:MAG TPA: hypothetical protein VGX25_05885 [Actinophytocola sp.]|uniref:hypothetical protein n=1 Tax=Actinophytocola sp. TaxID=1872138 RepID=UPI002DDD1522|nr:hypothetical protein [Actinophytocola sp.]HEV2778915.1 hypothetical protein [Actinophytocola sp.]
MARQTVPVDVRPERGPIKRRETVIARRRVPDAGVHLRKAVDSVLAELTAGTHPDPQALQRFADTLRGALAWTAAVGDTCRIAAAVSAVRDARLRLDADDLDEARVALLSARDGLRLPASRTPIE